MFLRFSGPYRQQRLSPAQIPVQTPLPQPITVAHGKAAVFSGDNPFFLDQTVPKCNASPRICQKNRDITPGFSCPERPPRDHCFFQSGLTTAPTLTWAKHYPDTLNHPFAKGKQIYQGETDAHPVPLPLEPGVPYWSFLERRRLRPIVDWRACLTAPCFVCIFWLGGIVERNFTNNENSGLKVIDADQNSIGRPTSDSPRVECASASGGLAVGVR